MCVHAFVAIGTLLTLFNEAAQRFRVEVTGPLSIFGVVVVHTVLVVVRLSVVAGHQLEVFDVKMFDGVGTPHPVISLAGVSHVRKAFAPLLELVVF